MDRKFSSKFASLSTLCILLLITSIAWGMFTAAVKAPWSVTGVGSAFLAVLLVILWDLRPVGVSPHYRHPGYN